MEQIRRTLSFSLFLFLSATFTIQANRLFVTQSGTGDGSSWGNAANLATVLTTATVGDTVFVASGEYTAPTGDGFVMADGIPVYGGFLTTDVGGDPDLLGKMDTIGSRKTILKGDGGRVLTQPADFSNVTEWAGFAITGGYAQGASSEVRMGGGAYLRKNGVLRYSSVYSNIAAQANLTARGGGIFNNGGTIIHCIIEGNITSTGSGTISGGGIANAGLVAYCIVRGNKVTTSSSGGGGGGIDNRAESSNVGTVLNCIIYNNTTRIVSPADNDGSGILNRSIGAKVINCTVANNIGSGISTLSGSSTINSIIWGNSSMDVNYAAGSSLSYTLYGTANASFSGTGNIVGQDPLFTDAATYNYGITANSPATDKGDNASIASYSTDYPFDLKGNERIIGDRVDIGAYEALLIPAKYYVNKNSASGDGTGSSWENASSSLTAILANARKGDVIWVAAGEYEAPTGDGFVMKDGVSVYGGLLNGDTDLSAMDTIGTRKTILKANKAGRVLTQQKDFVEKAEWAGFIITGGNSRYAVTLPPKTKQDDDQVNGGGGGVLLRKNGMLRFCTVTGNIGYDGTETYIVSRGGGVFNYGGTVTHCIVENNIASTTQNRIGATGSGGGISNYGGYVLYTLVRNNIAAFFDGYGGGIDNYLPELSYIINCVVENNIALYAPNNNGNPSGYGGGIRTRSKTYNINTTVVGNYAAFGGATSTYGGGIHADTVSNNINCIAWNNFSYQNNIKDVNQQDRNRFKYSIFSEANGSNNNSNADPQFLNPGNGVYRIASTSPALNSGYTPAITTDLPPGISIPYDFLGEARITGSEVDRGAFEQNLYFDVTMKRDTFLYNKGEYALELIGLPSYLPDTVVTVDILQKFTDVGAYEYQVTITNNKSPLTLVLKDTLVILPAKLTAIFEDQDVFYDGTKREYDQSKFSFSGLYGSDVATTTFGYLDSNKQLLTDDIINPGTYYVTVQLDGGKNYEVFRDTALLVVKPRLFENLTFKDSTAYYNGQAKPLTVEGDLTDVTLTYTNNDQKDVGTHTIEALLQRDNYKDTTLTTTLTILPAALTTVFPDQQVAYDGNAKAYDETKFEIEGLYGADQVTRTFAYLDSNKQPYTGNIVSAGTYYYTVRLDGNNNYNVLQDTALFIVSPVYFGETVSIASKTYTYDGQKKKISVEGDTDGTTITYKDNEQTNAGTYTVEALLKRSNYIDTTMTATLTIDPATLSTTFPEQTVYYTGSKREYDVSKLIVSGLYGSDDVTRTFTYLDSSKQPVTGDVIEAGIYYLAARLDGNSNYVVLHDTTTFIVESIGFGELIFKDATYYYDRQMKQLTVEGDLADATVTYTNNFQTEVGVYDVQALVQRPNYNDTILKAKLTILPPLNQQNYLKVTLGAVDFKCYATDPVPGDYYIKEGECFTFRFLLEDCCEVPYEFEPVVLANRDTIVADADGNYSVCDIRQRVDIRIIPNEKPVGNETLTSSGKIWAYGGVLYIHSGKARTIRIYGMAGQLHKQFKVGPGDFSLPLERGSYLVKGSDGAVAKVIIY